MKNIQRVMLTLVASALSFGCGGNGASNNDQGVSVTFLGLFSEFPPQNTNNQNNQNGAEGNQGCARLPTGLSGGTISLGTTVYAPPTENEGAFVDASGAYIAIVGLQNNLYGQFFRADRVLLEYYVPGATVQPPSTNVAVNLLAGPLESGQFNNPNGNNGQTNNDTSGGGLRKPVVTSLPPSFRQLCNRSFSQIPIIPAPIMEWLNFNSNQLPEAPFDLEVIVKLSGLSSSGNRYETNAGLFSFTVVPEFVINPTPPDDGADTTTSSVDVAADSSSTGQLNAPSEGEGDTSESELNDEQDSLPTESVVEAE